MDRPPHTFTRTLARFRNGARLSALCVVEAPRSLLIRSQIEAALARGRRWYGRNAPHREVERAARRGAQQEQGGSR